MILAIALFIAVSAVAASATRLKFVMAPTALDPKTVARALSAQKGSGGAALARLEAAVSGAALDAEWEEALVSALRAPAEVRTALINEQLSELDYRLQRWVRVPRVCASICTSSGFLLAATVLRVSLGRADSTEGAGAVDAAVFQAINVAAVGLAGAAFCIAVQMRARKASASAAEAFDRLVQQLERTVEAEKGGPTGPSKESPNVRTA